MVSIGDIQDVADRIALDFAPDRIILFGSYARGTPGPDSDVDLLVLMPLEGSSFRKSVEILNRVDPQFPVDVIARDSEESAQRYAQGDPLINDAFDHGQVLYDRRGTRMDCKS